MNTKTLIAAVVGAIAAFLLGWLVWGILLMDYFQKNTIQYEGLMLPEGEMKMWAIFIRNLLNGFLLAWLFSKMNVRTVVAGFQTGAIINLCISASMDMMFYSMMNWFASPSVMVVDIIVNSIFGGIIGAIIALILGRQDK